jgi:hypothetical protein
MVRRLCQFGLVASIAVVACSITVPFATRAQRYCCEGDDWLRWNQPRRDAYVSGYILGYYRGYELGCEHGLENGARSATPSSENSPGGICSDKGFDFSKGSDYFSKEVTAFYRQYPENRDLLIDELLDQLGKGDSTKAIHDHPPFPAPKSSNGPEASGQVK